MVGNEVDVTEFDVTEYVTARVNLNDNLSPGLFGEFPRGNFEDSNLRDFSYKCTVLQATIENGHGSSQNRTPKQCRR